MAKAFLAPKVPYGPHNAKIKVYYLPPISNALRNSGGGNFEYEHSIPP